MATFVLCVVIASSALAHGFVKSRHNGLNNSPSATYVPTDVPVSPTFTMPSQILNLKGAHTLSGEVILHHYLHNGNGAPPITSNQLIDQDGFAGPYNRGIPQLMQLPDAERSPRNANLNLSPWRSDPLNQYFNRNSISDNSQVLQVGPQIQQSGGQRFTDMPPNPMYEQATYPRPESHSWLPTSPQLPQLPQRLQHPHRRNARLKALLGEDHLLLSDSDLRKFKDEQRQASSNVDEGRDRTRRLPGMPTATGINSALSEMNA